jgi:hypothetical protein
MLDALFTTTSYFIVGDWRFEGNPLLPNQWYYFTAINAMMLLCAWYSKTVVYFYNIIRALALISHIVLWVQLARGVHMFPSQQFNVNVPIAIALPVIIIGVERLAMYVTNFIIDRKYTYTTN